MLIQGEGDTVEFRKQLGESARQLQQSLAWKSMYNNILVLRDVYFQKFMHEDADAAQIKKAIVVMESILKMPATFVEDGQRAKES